MIMLTLVAASLAIAVSACTPSLDASMGTHTHTHTRTTLMLTMSCTHTTALLPAAFVPFTIFSGFLVNESSVPSWVGWIKYFSLFKYGFQIVAINEFDGLEFTCKPSESVNGTCIFASTSSVSACACVRCVRVC
jgi:ABC-type multidrug transport system permease subunit